MKKKILLTFILYILLAPFIVFATDVTVDNNLTAVPSDHHWAQLLVSTDPTTLYAFYISASTNDFYYKKSTDSGATWGTAQTVSSGAVIAISVWYDKWTDDVGDNIHIVYLEGLVDDLLYRTLDTTDDTLGTEQTVLLGNTATFGTWSTHDLAITKARGGNLYVQGWIDSDEHGFARSTDGGATWGARTDGADGDAVDMIVLTPGNETDSQDVWMIYGDVSANEVSLKIHDDSGNSWSETSIDASAAKLASFNKKIDAVHRISDNHTIVAFWNDFNVSTADLKVYDIGGSASITAKTDVETNLAEATGIALQIDNQTDTIRAWYLFGSAFFATVDVDYKISTDGGATWGTRTQFSDDTAADLRFIMAPSGVGNYGGLWISAWGNDDLVDLLTNSTNSVAIVATSSYAQSAYRMFNNANDTDVGSALANQDTGATLAATGDAFRLRLLLHVATATLASGGQNFALQFVDKGAGTCTSPSGGTPASYTAVTTATAISFKDNASPSDGSALTSNASDPTHGADTVVNQTYEEANNFTNSQGAITSGQDGQWDFALYDNGASASTTFCFRVVRANGNTLFNYSVYPQITTAATAASLTFSVDPASQSFPALTPGTLVATTSILGVKTSNSTGFNITVARDDSDSTLDLDSDATVNISDKTNWSPGVATTSAGNATASSTELQTLQFRVRATGTDVPNFASTWWGSDDTTANALFAGLPSTAKEIANRSVSADATTTIYVLYNLDVPSTQKTGAYSGSVTFTATANP